MPQANPVRHAPRAAAALVVAAALAAAPARASEGRPIGTKFTFSLVYGGQRCAIEAAATGVKSTARAVGRRWIGVFVEAYVLASSTSTLFCVIVGNAPVLDDASGRAYEPVAAGRGFEPVGYTGRHLKWIGLNRLGGWITFELPPTAKPATFRLTVEHAKPSRAVWRLTP